MRHAWHKHVLVLASPLIVGIRPPALAADAETPVVEMETVSVYATKSATDSFEVPGIVSVVDTESPGNQGASTVKDVLQDVPGLELGGSARRNGQTISMRGYDNDGIIVLLDGVRQKFEAAHDGKFFIDPALLKSVEVVRGPGSTLYGTGGLGGVVAFETKDAADLLAPDEDLGFATGTGYQSVDDEAMVSASAFGRTDRADLLGSVVGRRSDDIELGDGSELNADDDVLSGLAKIQYSLTPYQTLGGQVHHYHGEAVEPNNPQSASNDEEADKDIGTTTVQLDYGLQGPARAWLDLSARLYAVTTEVEETLLIDSGTNQAGDRISRQLDTVGFGLENRSVFGGESWSQTLVYGIEAYQKEQDGNDTRNGEVGGIPDAEARFASAFVQDTLSWGSLTAVLGVRYDRYSSENATGLDQDESAVSPRLGLSWRATDWLLLFGQRARGFRAPTLTEIYTTGTHFTMPGMGSNVFVPNPDLKPEKNTTTEVGFGLDFDGLLTRSDRLRFKASAYRTRATDYIDTEVSFVPVPCCGTTTTVNVDEARLHGAEWEASYENHWLRLGLSQAYVTGKDEETNEYLDSISPRTTILNAAFRVAAIDSWLGWRVKNAAEHDQVEDPAAELDGYTVQDVYLQWNPAFDRDLKVRLGIDNVTDEEYSTVFAGSPEPGRNYTVNVGYQW